MAKNYRRHVKSIEDIIQSGRDYYAHIAVLTCGHRIVKLGGHNMRMSGAYLCRECNSDVMPVEETNGRAGAD